MHLILLIKKCHFLSSEGYTSYSIKGTLLPLLDFNKGTNSSEYRLISVRQNKSDEILAVYYSVWVYSCFLLMWKYI